jgi:hypothetical protein
LELARYSGFVDISKNLNDSPELAVCPGIEGMIVDSGDVRQVIAVLGNLTIYLGRYHDVFSIALSDSSWNLTRSDASKSL